MYLYSIYDKKSGVMSPLFCAENDFISRRAFFRSAGSGDLAVFPEDFDLYKVGEFDLHTGQVKDICPSEFVCSALEFVDRSDTNDVNQ